MSATLPGLRLCLFGDAGSPRTGEAGCEGLFSRFSGSLILDEVQRVPELLSYLQTQVDDPSNQNQFVLTGSQQLLLMEKVPQSLAGRSFLATLLPFSRQELAQDSPKNPVLKIQNRRLEDFLFTGGYPRIYDRGIPPRTWLAQYYATYVERDVRSLLNIGQLDLFQRFIRLCAGRVGQLVNFSGLANDCGISVPTAQAWLRVLQTSFVCFLLRPHFKNFNKRVIKAPKLYFYDTGLLCYLLGILEAQTLVSHGQRGSIFENWVVTERVKEFYNRGENPPLYFWRDQKGHEVDLLKDRGERLYPVEIKSSYTFHADFLANLEFFNRLQGVDAKDGDFGACVYGGEDSFSFRDYRVRSWGEL